MAQLKVTCSLTCCKYGLVCLKNGLVTFAFSSVSNFLDIKCPHFCQMAAFEARAILSSPDTTTFLYCID
jgi:hypothetical protein